MSDIDIYTNYYLHQIGSGYGGIYSGPAYQKGYGVGSFLGGLFRTISPVLPFLKSTGKAVGKELLHSGVGFLKDMTTEDIDTAYRKRGKELVNNLSARAAKKMFGEGYTYKGLPLQTYYQSTRRPQSRKRRKSANKKATIQKKSAAKKKRPRAKSDLQDIFA